MKYNIKKKSGIYIIINIINNKTYIGSAVNLSSRKTAHLNTLSKNKHKNSHLQNSYNKYGKGNFIFLLLEYVDDINKLIEKEQYYLDLLKPDYNICKIAGSSLGTKRDPERTKILVEKLKRIGHYDKLSKIFKGHKVSLETRLKIGAKNKNNKFRVGKLLTKESKNKIGSANSKIVICKDIVTNRIMEFKSLNDASAFVNTKCQVISLIIKNNKLYKKQYIFYFKP